MRNLQITLQIGNGHGGRGIFTAYPARDDAQSLRRLDRIAARRAGKQGTGALFPDTLYDDSTRYMA
ncbi:MAG: hypothetical protein ACREDJ_03565 [Methylocella sp.]